MAVFETIYAASPNRELPLWMSQMVNKVVEWRNIQLTRRALSALSDHELTDIGLTRWEIDRVAKDGRLV